MAFGIWSCTVHPSKERPQRPGRVPKYQQETGTSATYFSLGKGFGRAQKGVSCIRFEICLISSLAIYSISTNQSKPNILASDYPGTLIDCFPNPPRGLRILTPIPWSLVDPTPREKRPLNTPSSGFCLLVHRGENRSRSTPRR